MVQLSYIYQVGRVVVIVLLLTFLLNCSSAFAIGWKDKEWVEGDCPQDIIGVWVSEKIESSNKKSIIFQNHRINMIYNNAEIEVYDIKDKSTTEENNFIELALRSTLGNDEDNIFLKIRPHLVYLTNEIGGFGSGTSVCFIKVFKFNSRERVRFNKYSSWDIYQFKEK